MVKRVIREPKPNDDTRTTRIGAEGTRRSAKRKARQPPGLKRVSLYFSGLNGGRGPTPLIRAQDLEPPQSCSHEFRDSGTVSIRSTVAPAAPANPDSALECRRVCQSSSTIRLGRKPRSQHCARGCTLGSSPICRANLYQSRQQLGFQQLTHRSEPLSGSGIRIAPTTCRSSAS